MLSRKSAGIILFVVFVMLCGVAAAEDGGEFTSRDGALAGANFDLILSPSSTVGWQSGLTNGIRFSGSWSQPRIWKLPILVHGMEGYVLTAVVNGTGASGFAEVALQSTTATKEGYFGSPIVLASNPTPTSFVTEPSTAGFLITGIFFTGGVLRRRVLAG